MLIRLAVFDMAGTTVVDNNFVALAFKNAFANFGLEITDEEINPLMGYHKPQAIQMMLEKLEVDPDPEFIEEIHTDFENEMIEFYQYDDAVKPMPGAEEIFTFLIEKGVRVALNTGFSKYIADTIIDRFNGNKED